MTTDTFPKEVLVETVIDGKTVKIGGIAKGSGMIHPNMATMLSFIVTDINIGLEMIKEALKEVVDVTFNMISVDGDTSTNDMVLVMANGLAGNKMINEKNKDYHAFKEALFALCFKLAELIIRDGEGATKFVTVKVINAQTLEDARLAARSITTSNLVKTALFGEDANWGRVIAAIGYSGAAFDPNQVNMYIESARGSQQMMEKGMGLPFDEEKAKAILKEKDITLIVDLVSGSQEATAWTCDFSYDYVKINAEYRS
jgi:glutamate N-acetyltransferase/amino-acid N-acetyltransferase